VSPEHPWHGARRATGGNPGGKDALCHFEFLRQNKNDPGLRMDSDDGITIFDGRTRLTLVRAGEPRLGYPLRLEIASGSFSGTVEGEARIDPQFRQALKDIYKSLEGEAKLEFWSEQHSIVLTGTGLGHIRLLANLYGGSPWHARLTVEMVLDQSYLPDLIHGFARHFPEPG